MIHGSLTHLNGGMSRFYALTCLQIQLSIDRYLAFNQKSFLTSSEESPIPRTVVAQTSSGASLPNVLNVLKLIPGTRNDSNNHQHPHRCHIRKLRLMAIANEATNPTPNPTALISAPKCHIPSKHNSRVAAPLSELVLRMTWTAITETFIPHSNRCKLSVAEKNFLMEYKWMLRKREVKDVAVKTSWSHIPHYHHQPKER
jgi:hypothetical protein